MAYLNNIPKYLNVININLYIDCDCDNLNI